MLRVGFEVMLRVGFEVRVRDTRLCGEHNFGWGVQGNDIDP